MDPQNAIFEWLKPIALIEGWSLPIKEDYIGRDRGSTNQDYDDKIFNPQFYEKIKVDDQFYFNNQGAYLLIDNTVKKSTGIYDLMRLELHDYPEDSDLFWTIRPTTDGNTIETYKLNYTEWSDTDFVQSIKRSPSDWDIYYLTEYIGNPSFRPLNWTQFPDTLLP